ncbi:putative toxin-antitoxin system toxin component, PIN family [Fibrobacter sp. UWEL]|uniref:putative toxin-antitoxin system toxin component, PIN family n=1 Tax=Fibrobacter sp. UWEL TaxID=1896209 RepID=UPI000919382C|nr:putative toxin-antitoxin system toxin component, PIN family [Fibrobacter sp. UWEL]SHL29795.1 putative toxin-antitoxin system toxin component, PIN family [Fibrobacter sp. UWEL]
MVYAVVDTNVIVSSLLTKNPLSPVMLVMHELFAGKVQLLVNDAILAEYKEVLSRPKFHLDEIAINRTLDSIQRLSINVDAPESGVELPDPKDVVFYDVALACRDKDASLVTGNTKHFPGVPFVVTPREFLEILAKEGL